LLISFNGWKKIVLFWLEALCHCTAADAAMRFSRLTFYNTMRHRSHMVGSWA